MQHSRPLVVTSQSVSYWTQQETSNMINKSNTDIDSNTVAFVGDIRDESVKIEPLDGSPFSFGKILIDDFADDSEIMNNDNDNEIQAKIEDQDENENCIYDTKMKEQLTPTDFDIICGRSRLSHHHIGNKRFRIIVDMNRERYQHATSRGDKTRITQEIMDMIRASGGKFLKWNGKTWEDVGEDYVREKVSHALRSAKDTVFQRCDAKQKEENSIYGTAKARELFAHQQQIMMQLMSEAEAEAGDDCMNC